MAEGERKASDPSGAWLTKRDQSELREEKGRIVMLQQLSIFAENRKGTLQKIADILQKEDCNILGSVTNDSAEYGIIRMVVSDTDKAKNALEKEGYLCRTTDVLGVLTDDRPGALNRLLLALYNSNISVNYLYLSFVRESASPIMVMHTEDVWEVAECLKSKGFDVL